MQSMIVYEEVLYGRGEATTTGLNAEAKGPVQAREHEQINFIILYVYT